MARSRAANTSFLFLRISLAGFCGKQESLGRNGPADSRERFKGKLWIVQPGLIREYQDESTAS
jgi:hypothetical protein